MTTAFVAPAAPTGPDPWVHLAWRALGTDVGVTIVARSDAAAAKLSERAPAIVERLEAAWSRFRPESELSRLNRAAGGPVVVSPETFGAVAHAVEAWRATRGRFDPTVLPALLALGYDRDFATVAADGPATPDPLPAPGCASVVLDAVVRAVTLPAGMALDLGGIGKGLAADRVVEDLLAVGAVGVCADLGGDVRVAGTGPTGQAWPVVVDDPLATGAAGTLVVAGGGIATSTRLRRCWRRDGRPVHHIVDPRTGDSARNGLASVTVVAGTAAWAEVFAKAAFVAGAIDGADLLAAVGVTGLFVHDDGRVTELPGLDAFRP